MTQRRRGLLTVVLVLPALAAFMLWAFAWPVASGGPHDLPVGVAGQPPAADELAARLDARDGAFDVHRYPDEATAREAIAEREIYGAFVADGATPQLLTAGAASPAVAQLLQQLATEQAPDGVTVTVVDVVPTPPGDPRGGAFTASLLPMAVAGIATGALITVTRLRGRWALLALAVAAPLTGAVAAWLGDSWLGVLAGDWWTVAGTLTLFVLAGGATVAGAAALLGPRGIALGGVLLMLLGNPWSGASSAPEMLPEPVGVLGQFLPTGAGATLLRSVSFFDGHGAAFPLAVLLTWTAAGVAAILLSRRRAVPPPGAAAAREPATAAV
ncbi:ABC transporter permease [Streptomyces hainanensis]|uniref:ABC transporter permease n=1 Tax=Streptomyces hainanensis TaxID=402648 RepID=A0A4R4TEA5_9ACTN|nr:ABC transporter permease [Streptomyces hainanensis]TDC75861.1 ABC transporter permease [Streptomyces hainanensis]